MSPLWWIPIGLGIWLVAGLALGLVIGPVLRLNSLPCDDSLETGTQPSQESACHL